MIIMDLSGKAPIVRPLITAAGCAARRMIRRKTMKSTMTRRDFLKLSGLGAAGAAASLMFAACAKQEATPNAQNEDAATAREASKETAGDTADLPSVPGPR